MAFLLCLVSMASDLKLKATLPSLLTDVGPLISYFLFLAAIGCGRAGWLGDQRCSDSGEEGVRNRGWAGHSGV